MESLGSNAVNFSPQYILNLGQLDILSRFDSFGDIPGHGEIFLDRKILWSLKTNLVLFWMSFVVLYKMYPRGKWSEMPMDVIRQLSVTFPDCSESSVLDAITVVTFSSYNFPTGEKQHGSLFRSFVEQYEKILFREVYLVLQFLLADNYNLEFQNLRAVERMFDGKIFFVSLVSLNRISSHIFSGLLSFFLSLYQHQNFIKLFRTVLLVLWICQCGMVAVLLRTLSFSTNQFQDSRFMTCFQNIYNHVFYSFFLISQKG